MEYSRRIDNSLYSRKALAAARQAYRGHCTVRAAPLENDLATVTVVVNQEYAQEERQVVLEFWNYFLDTSCQQRLESA